MTLLDYILMSLFLGGAIFLLFKSLFKKGKMQCPGCDSDSCSVNKKIQKPKF